MTSKQFLFCIGMLSARELTCVSSVKSVSMEGLRGVKTGPLRCYARTASTGCLNCRSLWRGYFPMEILDFYSMAVDCISNEFAGFHQQIKKRERAYMAAFVIGEKKCTILVCTKSFKYEAKSKKSISLLWNL